MEREIATLPLSERTDVDASRRVYSHAAQRRQVRHWRNQDVTIVLEADEPAIKQVIDTRRQEQPIFAIQALVITRVTPRFAMTRPQMLNAIHSG